MFFNRGNTMKKILLLSALFGGFVLNNGYCYDAKDEYYEPFLQKTEESIDQNQRNLRKIGTSILQHRMKAGKYRGQRISELLSRNLVKNDAANVINELSPSGFLSGLLNKFSQVKIEDSTITLVTKDGHNITVQLEGKSAYKIKGYGREVCVFDDDLSK